MKAQGTAICSPDFIQGLSWLICLRLFVLLCFADLASFSNLYPSECSLSCPLWIDLQKHATWQLLRFSTGHCTSRWSKTCIGWKFDRKKNLFIFPSLIHKIKGIQPEVLQSICIKERHKCLHYKENGEKKILFNGVIYHLLCWWPRKQEAVCTIMVRKRTWSSIQNQINSH